MKILIVHNSYQQAGGEDAVVRLEQAVLEKHGHIVSVYTVSNDAISGVMAKVSVARSIAYSKKSCDVLIKVIGDSQPDIVHVHNFFPLITPSVFDACIASRVPVVQTLHNYRLICPGGFLLRKGKVCELCVSGSAYSGAFHACYRDSYVGSYFVANMVQRHRNRGTWKKKVDRYIALTSFARSKFIEGGLPGEKITVKSNFYSETQAYVPPVRFDEDVSSSYGLFVGRLSDEKGIKTLLKAWGSIDYPLHIAGEGPLLEWLHEQNNPNVKCLGHVDAAELTAQMRSANFLLLPSEWYEGFPMVIVEAFAHALPVIASRLGSMAEIVVDHETGIHFEAGNAIDLADKIGELIADPELRSRLARNAYNEYQEKYTAESNYRALLAIYKDVISSYALQYS